MSSQPVRLLDPVRWAPDLIGEFPGQQSFIELGPEPVRMVFCWCPPTPPGRPFVLGSPPDELGRDNDETQHPVDFPQGFWLAQHPVNQRQWRAVMGTKPGRRGGSDPHPVYSVSWKDAREFCRKTGLRLPREAEWEYACRAGATTPFGIGGGDCLNAQLANFDGNHPYGAGRESFEWLWRERTLPEGSFPPNAWGLHDMHGQLWEWCEDEYAGRSRVLRGGGWSDPGRLARSASRFRFAPDPRNDYIGFRPCPSSTQGQGQAGGRPREFFEEHGLRLLSSTNGRHS